MIKIWFEILKEKQIKIWLGRGWKLEFLKTKVKETVAEEAQSMQAKVIKAKPERIWNDSQSQLGNIRDETVEYLINSCRKIAQSEYNQYQDRVAKTQLDFKALIF